MNYLCYSTNPLTLALSRKGRGDKIPLAGAGAKPRRAIAKSKEFDDCP